MAFNRFIYVAKRNGRCETNTQKQSATLLDSFGSVYAFNRIRIEYALDTVELLLDLILMHIRSDTNEFRVVNELFFFFFFCICVILVCCGVTLSTAIKNG